MSRFGYRNQREGQRGALLVLFALLLPVFFACAGLAVDLGNMYSYKSNLQNAVDAAALAGASGYTAGGALLVFVIFALATRNPVTGLLALLLFLAADFVFVQRRITKRLDNFQRQLADCLSLVANSLRAGFSFLQTMEIISREMEPPMSTEFERVMRDTTLGKSLDDALHDMDDRVGSADFSLVVTAVLIQQQVGGNLATILDTIRQTISERIRIRREVNTLTAQGKMSGIVLACIPVALGLFFYVSSPEYLEPLLTTDIGRIAIIGAVFLVIVGFAIIRKIVDIKV